ncbi:MAG: DUF3368 domain-containing protein [archaeon]
MNAVSDSSPLIFFMKLGRLDLLGKLFGKVLVPKQVLAEIGVREGAAHTIEKCLFAEIKPVRVKSRLFLGSGETAVILLAVQTKVRIVLLDDKKARTAAKAFGLKPLGTIGVLAMALQRKLITKKEYLALLELLIENGFRMGIELYALARKQAGNGEK